MYTKQEDDFSVSCKKASRDLITLSRASPYITSSMCSKDNQHSASFLDCKWTDRCWDPQQSTAPCDRLSHTLNSYVSHPSLSALGSRGLRPSSSEANIHDSCLGKLMNRETLSAEHLWKTEYALEHYHNSTNHGCEDLCDNFSPGTITHNNLAVSTSQWTSQAIPPPSPLQFSMPLTKSLDDFEYASYPTNISLFMMDTLDETKKDIAPCEPCADGQLLKRYATPPLKEKLLSPFSSLDKTSEFSKLCLESLTLKDATRERNALGSCDEHPASLSIESTSPYRMGSNHQRLNLYGPYDATKSHSTNTSPKTHEVSSPFKSLKTDLNSFTSTLLSDHLHQMNPKIDPNLCNSHWIPLNESLDCPEQLHDAHVVFHLADVRRNMFPDVSHSKTAPDTLDIPPVAITSDSPKALTGTTSTNGVHPVSCKPCAFFWTKGCVNGTACQFCHAQHIPKKKKSIEDQKNLLIIARPDGRIEYLRCNVKEALLRC